MQDANAGIRTSPKHRKFYNKIKRKKGHNVAIVAVARKLVKYIFWVLKNEKEFIDDSKKKRVEKNFKLRMERKSSRVFPGSRSRAAD